MAAEVTGMDIWGIKEYYSDQLRAVGRKMSTIHAASLLAQGSGNEISAASLDEILFDITDRRADWGEPLFPLQ